MKQLPNPPDIPTYFGVFAIAYAAVIVVIGLTIWVLFWMPR